MSHGKTREDKVCLNCGHMVEERFCPNCGQENIETRQPFHYLFTHFIEDFTHYDGQFWKTIKYLLFRPGKLTKEYLAGKRQLYVAPVKLYIFVSFITFLLPSLFSNSEDEHKDKAHASQEIQKEKEKEQKIIQLTDSLKTSFNSLKEETEPLADNKLINVKEIKDSSRASFYETRDGKMIIAGAKNLKQFDSLYHKKDDFADTYIRPFAKKIFYLQDKGLSGKEISSRFVQTLVHTLPKALFIYLPIFAFFLWLFHNKKRWWYFDHGIFTLHYFSFLLLGTLIFIFGTELMSILPDYGLLNLLAMLLYASATIYMCIYFFIAHHGVYETRRRTSILKGSLLFIVNFFGLLIMLIILACVSFLTMH